MISCNETAPEKFSSGEKAELSEQHFLLNSFPVKQISIPEDSGNLLPWTGQTRISDYAVAGDYLFLAVNNTGIMKIPLDNPSVETMQLYREDRFFSGNTMKSLFYFNGSIFCHLYHDTFFSEDYSASALSPVIKLNSDNTFTAEFKRSSELERKEAVDFVFSDSCWVSSWKMSDRDSNSFSYYRHDIHGNNISPVSESYYREKLLVSVNNENSDPSLVKIYNFVQSLSCSADITDLSVKYSGCTSSENYRYVSSSEESGSYISVPVYRTDECLWFTADNRIYCLENNKISRISSARLPEGYRYTGICSSKGRIYLFWEYQSFFNTGNSGFSVIDEKGVDKIAI